MKKRTILSVVITITSIGSMACSDMSANNSNRTNSNMMNNNGNSGTKMG